MKKILILLIIFALLCTIISCGEGENGATSGSSSSSSGESTPNGNTPGGSDSSGDNGNTPNGSVPNGSTSSGDNGNTPNGSVPNGSTSSKDDGNHPSDDGAIPEGGLKYQYNLDDYITLPSYKGYEVTISLDAIQQHIDSCILDKSIKSKRTICMAGDVVNVSYFGYRIDENGEILYENGKPVTFDENASYGVYLGSNLALAEFEKGIVGMKIGDIKEIYVTFPSDYFQTELAGERVIFEIILNEIYEAPLYNDTFVKNNYENYQDVDGFEKGLRQEESLEKLYEYLSENCVIKAYPEKEYNAFAKELKDMEKEFEERYKMSLDEYINKEFQMTRDEYIKSEIKKELIIYSLARSENIEPTNEQLAKERETLINYYTEYYVGMGADKTQAGEMARDIVEDLGKSYIYENVMYELVDNKVIELIVVKETPLTYKSITTVFCERQEKEKGSDIGDVCPSFEAEVFDENGGLDTTLDPSRNVGKLTVINFWGIWCGPCKSELPHFDRVATEYKDQVTVYAVHSSTKYGEASDYILENFADSCLVFLKDVAINPNDSYSQDMHYSALGGNGYYPYTLILDENGIIVSKHVGMLSYEQLIDMLVSAGLEK